MDHSRRPDRPKHNESDFCIRFDKGSELVVVGVGIRCHFKLKIIGVVRGGELLTAKIFRDAEGGLFTRVNNIITESPGITDAALLTDGRPGRDVCTLLPNIKGCGGRAASQIIFLC